MQAVAGTYFKTFFYRGGELAPDYSYPVAVTTSMLSFNNVEISAENESCVLYP